MTHINPNIPAALKPKAATTAQTLAAASCFAPLLAFGLSCLLASADRANPGRSAPGPMDMDPATVRLTVVGLLITLGLALAAAAIALAMHPTQQKRLGVVLTALLGLAINLGAIGLIVVGYYALQAAARSAAMVKQMHLFDAEAADYRGATDRFVQAGGISARGLAGPADADARLALLDECARLNDRLDQSIQDTPGEVRAAMAKAGASREAVERGVASASAFLHLDLNHQIHENQHQQYAAARKLLTLYKEHWGGVHYDAATDRLTFDAEEDLRTYNAIMKDIKALAERGAGLDAELAQAKRPG